MNSSPRDALAQTIRYLAQRGWSPGTGGNFSVVSSRSPLTLLMSPSGIDKSHVTPEELIIVNEAGQVIEGKGKASAETAIHLVLAQKFNAGCILHTHSVWNTVLSRATKVFDSIRLSGFEMLKALGETTHETYLDIPVFPNTQDIECFADMLSDEYEKYKTMKGFLMAGHGLYTWGNTIADAKRHVEALEFLFEVEGTEKLLRTTA